MPTIHRSSSSASTAQKPTFKFPDLAPINADFSQAIADGGDVSPGTFSSHNGFVNGFANGGGPKEQRWQPHKRERNTYGNGGLAAGPRRNRQKSLSEAFRTIKDRRGSVTENAHEIAEALKAPVSPKLVILCGFWYMTSIFSNASSKAILTAFRYPVTLTVVQFAFVSSWCILSSQLARAFPSLQRAIPALRYSIRKPSRELIMVTLPLTAFQIGGHILNSDAMSRIPVSLVHTIKGLSPLFTVLAYRIVFRVHYSYPTYLSLIPLTLGVIMASSSNFSANTLGLVYAFGSAILFVTQNIVSKKLFNEAARAESEGMAAHLASRKPDKLNLLCYSSGLALIFTLPLWFFSEGLTLMHDIFHKGGVSLTQRPDALDSRRLVLEFIFNGTFHFAQSLVAFVLLSMVSPVTYSVASLIKRVFVVTFSIVWFGNPMSRVQASGIALTFVGLYLYDRTNDAARADRRLRALQEKAEPSLLPLATADKSGDVGRIGRFAASPLEVVPNDFMAGIGYGNAPQKRMHSPSKNHVTHPPRLSDDLMDPQRRRSSTQAGGAGLGLSGAGGWLPPGTRQEETWTARDGMVGRGGTVVA